MIIIINGPLGVGKSQTSWQLLERFERAALLEGDYIAAFHPFDYYNQAQLDYAYGLLGALAAHHVAHGFAHLVVNWVFESPAQLERIKAALAPCGLPIHAFWLTCDPHEIERRVRKRNNSDLLFELRRSRELIVILEAAAKTGDIGQRIDTTHLALNEVVETIWRLIHA